MTPSGGADSGPRGFPAPPPTLRHSGRGRSKFIELWQRAAAAAIGPSWTREAGPRLKGRDSATRTGWTPPAATARPAGKTTGVRTSRRAQVPALLRGPRRVTSRPPPGGSARRGAASDGPGAPAAGKACVSSTTWWRLPFLSLLLSVCPLVPRRKQTHLSYSHGPGPDRPLGDSWEKGRRCQPSRLGTLSSGPVQIKARQLRPPGTG